MSSDHDPAESLADIVENAERIESYLAGMDRQAFESDGRTRDAVERCLERICEGALRLGGRAADHAAQAAYLLAFVADYNRTRLRCLDYQAPAQALANLTGHNTHAGMNRAQVSGRLEGHCVPRTRVAPAGMNRRCSRASLSARRVPRTRARSRG